VKILCEKNNSKRSIKGNQRKQMKGREDKQVRKVSNSMINVKWVVQRSIGKCAKIEFI
jgi:hypothetical protein